MLMCNTVFGKRMGLASGSDKSQGNLYQLLNDFGISTESIRPRSKLFQFQEEKALKPIFKVGDKVKVQLYKCYDYDGEVFEITKIRNIANNSTWVFTLLDKTGEEVEELFYEDNLTLV